MKKKQKQKRNEFRLNKEGNNTIKENKTIKNENFGWPNQRTINRLAKYFS